jgi:hypothetical protein
VCSIFFFYKEISSRSLKNDVTSKISLKNDSFTKINSVENKKFDMDEISLVEKELKDSLKLQRLQKSKQNTQKDQDLEVQQQGK